MARAPKFGLSSPCYVYVITRLLNDGFAAPCKIGISADPDRRVASIATSSPFPIGLYARFGPFERGMARDIERCIHSTTAGRRLSGEWFDAEPIVTAQRLAVAIGMGMMAFAKISSDEALGFTRAHSYFADPRCLAQRPE